MPDSVTSLDDRLREIARTTASVSANMDTLLGHFGIAGATDEEVDRVLAEEARRGSPVRRPT